MKNKLSPPVIQFNLVNVLKERGLTQRAAARIAGISKNGISVLCGEPTQIKLETLQKLCAAFSLRPGDLFTVESPR